MGVLLDDFKTATGATEADQFIIDYYLQPALIKCAEFSNFKKKTIVTLVSGTQDYDLTSSSIATPVVANGVQAVSYDDNFPNELEYKDEWYMKDPTNLFLVDPDTTSSGAFEFNYYSFFSLPVLPSTDTDLPDILKPSVIRYAKAVYLEDGQANLASGSGSGNTGGAVTEIREANSGK